MTAIQKLRNGCVAIIALGLSLSAQAATVTWTGASDNNWATAGNWSGGTPSSVNDVVFYASGANNLSNYLSAPTSVKSLMFTNTATSSVTVKLSTNNFLTLPSGNGGVTVLAGNHTLVDDGLTGSGVYALKLNSTTWNIAAGASLTNKVRMSNNGTITITKAGEGLLVLAANSGSSGGIGSTFAINAGILRAIKSGALGLSGNTITVADGAGLELQAMTSSNPNGILTLNGTGVGGDGALRCLAGSSDLTSGSGSVKLNSSSAIGVDAGGTLSIYQVIQGVGGLTKVGTGALLLLNSTNSYSGGTTVSVGTLKLSGGGILGDSNGVLTVNGGTLDLNDIAQSVGNFTGNGGMVTNGGGSTVTLTIGNGNGTGGNAQGVLGGNLSLTKIGTGTIALSGANSYSGATTVNNGTLTLSSAGGTLSGTTGVTVKGGGTFIDGDNTTPANNNGVTDRIKNTIGLTLGGGSGGGIFTMAFPSSGTHAQTLGTLTIAEGSNTINTVNTAAGTMNLTFAGNEGGYLRTSSESFLNVVTAAGFNPGFAAAPTDVTGVSVAGTANPILIGAFLNNADFIAAAAGTMAAPAYQTTWGAGATGNNINMTSALTAGNTSVNSLRFNDATARTLTLKTSGITTNTSGMILVGSSAGINSTITGGTLTSGNGSELIVTDFRAIAAIRDLNAMFKLLSILADNGATPISLTVVGGATPLADYKVNGQVQLGNSNTFTGGTTLNKCSVVVSADGAFGAVPASAQSDNIRIIDGGYIKTGAAFTLNANRGISLLNNATLTLDSYIAPLTVNGVISGTGTVCGPANRTGLTILTGSNTFSGMLTIQNYVRADDGVGLSPNANLSLADNGQGRGTLQTHGTFTRSVGTGPGQVRWGGWYAGYPAGGFSAVGGPLTINLGGQATPSALTWNKNTFIISALVLQDTNADALLTWLNPINLDTANRSFMVAAGKTAVLAGALSGNGGGISLDKVPVAGNLTGTLILAETNTYTGTTTINAGTLQIGNSGSTGTLGGGLVNNNSVLVFSRSNSYNVTNLITGTGSLVQNGAGTLTLSNTNSYSGLTTVTNGTLAAGCDLALNAGNALTLSGGTFDAGSSSNALGTLTLTTGTTNTLAVNSGTCKLSFTNLIGTGTLAITGTVGPQTLRFGTDSTALTTPQLNLIRANNKKVYLDVNGYLLAVPDGTMVRFF